MTSRTLTAPVLAGILLWSAGQEPVAGQLRLTGALELEEAYLAWDEGRYLDAIDGYLALLEGPEGEAWTEEIARRTGELHPVQALAEDGTDVRISPDGAYLFWRRAGPDGWTTTVVPTDGGEVVHVPGQVAALSGTGVLAWVIDATMTFRDLTTGEERRIPLGDLQPLDLVFSPSGSEVYFTSGREGEGDRLWIFRITEHAAGPEPLALGPGHASDPIPVSAGRFLVFTRPSGSPLATAPGMPPTSTPEPGIGILDLESEEVVRVRGAAPSVAADGSFLAFLDTQPGVGVATRILGLSLDASLATPGAHPQPRVLLDATHLVADPAVSPTGTRVAYAGRQDVSWEVFTVPVDGSGAAARVTREVQHDRFPAWISEMRLLAMKGEFRHRRGHVYDLRDAADGAAPPAYRLFHNNTLRTIAPEYEWAVHPEGDGVLVTAQRDGDTVVSETPVFWVDLTRTVTRRELIDRLRAAYADEADLLARGEARFTPLAEELREVTAEVSVSRIQRHAAALYSFGSKFLTQPGNALAIEYLGDALRSWGYDVEFQRFDVGGTSTANVVATLPGTRNPDLVYVVSSHFDSVLLSPGADDNSSGTTALLEVARVLSQRPRAATIQFVFLTAEEAGLLGAEEFVRRAVDERKWIAAVLNNDMVGWTRNHRWDNTVRYSNPGIRDVQHAAAHFFSDLITYDARYTRGTDAAVFHQVYGDITGGIGSYPVLGNPHYHQPTDRLHTVDQRLVGEVARTTVASIVLLADSPMPVEGLHVAGRGAGEVEAAWLEAPEDGVVGYRVQGERGAGNWIEVDLVLEPQVRVRELEGFSRLRIRAIGARGLEGWDWTYLDL